jgi:transcriptional regulator of arginine metabolism
MARPPRSRRELVRTLLAEREVKSQAELLGLLAERGVQATQPALSRDLRALGVAKSGGVYRLDERVTPLGRLASLLRGARTAGEHLLVVRCEPGAASAVARALEADEPDGLIGTVAGDDTFFVAVERATHAKRIQRRIEDLIE